MSEITKTIFYLDAQMDEIKKQLVFVLDACLANYDECPLPVRNAASHAIDVIKSTRELDQLSVLTNAELEYAMPDKKEIERHERAATAVPHFINNGD